MRRALCRLLVQGDWVGVAKEIGCVQEWEWTNIVKAVSLRIGESATRMDSPAAQMGKRVARKFQGARN